MEVCISNQKDFVFNSVMDGEPVQLNEFRGNVVNGANTSDNKCGRVFDDLERLSLLEIPEGTALRWSIHYVSYLWINTSVLC